MSQEIVQMSKQIVKMCPKKSLNEPNKIVETTLEHLIFNT